MEATHGALEQLASRSMMTSQQLHQRSAVSSGGCPGGGCAESPLSLLQCPAGPLAKNTQNLDRELSFTHGALEQLPSRSTMTSQPLHQRSAGSSGGGPGGRCAESPLSLLQRPDGPPTKNNQGLDRERSFTHGALEQLPSRSTMTSQPLHQHSAGSSGGGPGGGPGGGCAESPLSLLQCPAGPLTKGNQNYTEHKEDLRGASRSILAAKLITIGFSFLRQELLILSTVAITACHYREFAFSAYLLSPSDPGGKESCVLISYHPNRKRYMRILLF